MLKILYVADYVTYRAVMIGCDLVTTPWGIYRVENVVKSPTRMQLLNELWAVAKGSLQALNLVQFVFKPCVGGFNLAIFNRLRHK